jgi:putative tricarboxylic transport membrane protein
MIKAQRITGILFVAVGAYVTWYSIFKLDLGKIGKPGSGFFTLVCGAGILVLSAIWLFSNLRNQEDKGSLWAKRGWLSPLTAVASVFVYAFLMEPLGYIISTALFIILWQILVSRGKIKTIIIFAVIGTAAMYILFGILLSVPVPRGLLRF